MKRGRRPWGERTVHEISTPTGLLILTDEEHRRALRRGQSVRRNRELAKTKQKQSLDDFFRIGISGDYILMRQDLPIEEILPGDFKSLLMELFQRNDEVLERGR